MRHTEFWTRLEEALGPGYAGPWAKTQVIGTLGSRTPQEALDAGVPPKEVWREVWRVLELPPSQR
jgi:hypothetical protein